MPDKLPGSQETIPAAQVRKMIQQTIQGGPMSHKSRRASSRARRRETNAPSRNNSHNLAQANLAGQNEEELDTEAFGDDFPTKPAPNTHRPTDSKIHRTTDPQTHRPTDPQTHRHTGPQTHRPRDPQTHRPRLRQYETLRTQVTEFLLEHSETFCVV